jgi:aspartate/methionine/tyrosine aminotransferase
MPFPTFLLERNQTLYENAVEINLTESGVHPCTIADLLSAEEIAELASLRLGYGHTEGRPGLRRAVAEWYPDAGPENVLIAHGSSEAHLIALMSLVERDEDIVFITPNFMQLDGLARGLGIAVRQVPLSADNGWQPDLDRINAAIGPHTRLITLCDPNNPTGTMLTDRMRRDLAELAKRRGVWLLVDEIYRGSEIDGGPALTAWNLAPRVIVSGGLSKSFACAGLRLGWLIAPPDVIDQCHRRQDYTSIGTGTIAQFLAERAMQPAKRDGLLQRGRQILAAGRETVREWLAQHNGWSWVEPRAGGMTLLAYDFGMPSEELSARLRTEESVFVCAGAWFGIEGHIRIGIGVAPDHLKEGLRRLDRFVDRHRLSLDYARQ